MTTIQWVTPNAEGAVNKGSAKEDSVKRVPLLSKPSVYIAPHFSPDGTRISMVVEEPSKQGVWVYDIARDAMTRLTTAGGPTLNPIWSPDGRYIIFGAYTGGLFWTQADGAIEPRLLLQTGTAELPTSFTPDGKRLMFTEIGAPSQLWSVPIEEANGQFKTGKAERFLMSQFSDAIATVSPDGKWLAYFSDATGGNEVFVRAFPDNGGRWQISNNGMFPKWSANGRDLLYQSGVEDLTDQLHSLRREILRIAEADSEQFLGAKTAHWRRDQKRLPELPPERLRPLN